MFPLSSQFRFLIILFGDFLFACMSFVQCNKYVEISLKIALLSGLNDSCTFEEFKL